MGSEDNARQHIIKTPAWSFYLNKIAPFAVWSDIFTHDECEKIISTGSRYVLEDAKISLSEKQNADIRKSTVVFLSPYDIEWVYRRLTDAVIMLNDRFFKFDIFGCTESLQYTEYESPNGKYDAHVDTIYNGVIRKLSAVIQLTDSNLYEGGDLELLNNGEQLPIKMPRDRGSLIIFPSYTLHRVTPVTKGIRNSLVGWISGKPFK